MYSVHTYNGEKPDLLSGSLSSPSSSFTHFFSPPLVSTLCYFILSKSCMGQFLSLISSIPMKIISCPCNKSSHPSPIRLLCLFPCRLPTVAVRLSSLLCQWYATTEGVGSFYINIQYEVIPNSTKPKRTEGILCNPRGRASYSLVLVAVILSHPRSLLHKEFPKF